MGFCGGDNDSGRVNDKFQKGTRDDISGGPVATRSCTDLWFLVIWIVHVLVFLVIALAGFQDGNATKLYKPRDFRGSYCGVIENWNNGPNLQNFPWLATMMNVSSVAGDVAKEMMCGSASYDALMGAQDVDGLLTTKEERDTYLCACCFRACAGCTSNVEVEGDMDLANVEETVTTRMMEMINPARSAELFSPASDNWEAVSALWDEASSSTLLICMPGCSHDQESLAAESARSYTYEPDADEPLLQAWTRIRDSDSTTLSEPIKATMLSAFTFEAFPKSTCPYEAEYCVPLPGVRMEEGTLNYCATKMPVAVEAVLGESVGVNLEHMKEEVGFGVILTSLCDLMQVMDVLAMVTFFSLVAAFVYMALLRFCIVPVVWSAVLGSVIVWFLLGGMIWVRAVQCADAGFWDTARQSSVAIGTTVMWQANSTVILAQAGEEGDDIDPTSLSTQENCTGNCYDYRGMQRFTMSGLTCQKWSSQTPHEHDFTKANYPDSGLVGNFCRNPWKEGDVETVGIWCFVKSEEVVWEACRPIGVIEPYCPRGHAVPGENSRKALKIVAAVVWGFAVVYLLFIFCIRDRISLAIKLNVVAIQFFVVTPQVLLVPFAQACLVMTCVPLWVYLVSFMLSQVPDGYTPKGYFATYDEAAGTASEPGACTDKWPVGFVWKDHECLVEDGVVKCWRCGPPRYIFDARFAFCFFSYLWNSFLNIALGQCIISGAVGCWFFSASKGFAPRVRRSAWRALRYHLGSLCFGSFIIAAVSFTKYVVKYFEKQAAAQKQALVACILKIVQCCLWCLEKILIFINTNAYIQIALVGTNFCVSAKRACKLIMSNFLRFGVVLSLGSLVTSFSLVFLTVVTTIFGYFAMRSMYPEVSMMMPLLFCGLIGIITGKTFTTILELAVFTALQCFVIAEELGIDDVIPKVLKGTFSARRSSGGGSVREEASGATEGVAPVASTVSKTPSKIASE